VSWITHTSVKFFNKREVGYPVRIPTMPAGRSG
jgi:hypothetical protein